MRTRFRRHVRGLAAPCLAVALGLSATPVPSSAATVAEPVDAPGAGTAAAGDLLLRGSTKVRSSTGKQLRVVVQAARAAEGGDGALLVTLARGREQHRWQFRLPATDLTVGRKGRGSLRTEAAGDFGTVSLRVVPKKRWKVEKCGGRVASRWRPVVVRGTFRFASGSAWGAVGKKRGSRLTGKVRRFGPGGTCIKRSCSGPVGWASAYDGAGESVDVTWRPGKKHGTLTAHRSEGLAAPEHAVRYDTRTVRIPAPELVTDGDAAELAITTAGKGARGSVTLTGAPEARHWSDPRCGGVRYPTTTWSGATYTNGDVPLEVRMPAFGGVSLGDGAHGAFGTVRRG